MIEKVRSTHRDISLNWSKSTGADDEDVLNVPVFMQNPEDKIAKLVRELSQDSDLMYTDMILRNKNFQP